VIDVFERRREGAGGGYGTRKIVLAVSSQSQALLNGAMLNNKGGLVGTHDFAPTCSINAIEGALKQEYDKYACCSLCHEFFH
jgi:hypothetical protein